MYDKELLIFKDCKITLFENLYQLYKKEILSVLKVMINKKLKTTYEKEHMPDKEIFHYMRSLRKVDGQL